MVSDNSRIVENKHILAYVSGLGFGIMSGAFALVNILADSVCIKWYNCIEEFLTKNCVSIRFRWVQQRLAFWEDINTFY